MDKQKAKVSWTLDESTVKGVKDAADKLSQKTGVKVSESAMANLLLKERLEQVNEKAN